MKKIAFDSGVQEYRLGSGCLRFNPADPNLYARFLEAMEKLHGIEQRLTAQLQDSAGGAGVIRLLSAFDRELKQLLGWVFGADFDALLAGVNLLAVNADGQRVISALLGALEPILTEGARRCAEICSAEAVAHARERRANQ